MSGVVMSDARWARTTIFTLAHRRSSCIDHVIIGVSPSGKAAGFDPAIRRFESFHPSQKKGCRYLDCRLLVGNERQHMNSHSVYSPQPLAYRLSAERV